jgi:hypothetical protein
MCKRRRRLPRVDGPGSGCNVESHRIQEVSLEGKADAGDVCGSRPAVVGPFTLDPGPQLQPGKQPRLSGLPPFTPPPTYSTPLNHPTTPTPSTTFRARCYTPPTPQLGRLAHANRPTSARARPS